MAIVQKTWQNGDTLILNTSGGGISVTSDQNLTGADRVMVVQLRTTNQGDKAMGSFTVKQQADKGVLPSYMILTDDTRIDFELDNTPINNLATIGDATSPITVNGQSVVKNTIKEVYFGDSYNGVTSIGSFFLTNFSSLTSVDLSPLSSVISIENNFLADCTSLTSIDLSPLSNVTSIGNYFLSFCTSLTSIDLSPLSNVTSIGTYFLYKCSSLTSVDLSPLSNVTSIGTYFLYYCSGLTSVDLSLLSNITSIGNYFLSFCSSLTEVDLSPLSNVTSIGNWSLSYCANLTTLIMGAETPPILGGGAFSNSNNLSLILVPCGSESAYKSATNWITKASIIEEYCPPSYMILTDDTVIEFDLDNTPISNLSTTGDATSSITINGQSIIKNSIKEIYFGDSYNDVTSIGHYFLYSCSSLTSVDLSPLSNVTSIGNSFLDSCTSLTSVDLSPLSKVTSIGHGFLYWCRILTSVDLSTLTNVTSIENDFLSSCSSLTSVDLSGLTSVTSIGTSFLDSCTSLTSVDLSPLSNVTSIGNYFLNSCPSLTSVDLSPLSNLTSIGNYFLQGCSSLTSVDLSPLSNVTSIGTSFLSWCSGLTSVDLSPLSGVTSIGSYFLSMCSSLATLIMGAETPPTLGSNAFGNSNNLSLISVPCGSESAYKSATNWINKASIIQEDCPITSYMILTDNTRINFDLDNTPLSNLSTSGKANSSITVNGQSVVKNTIKEVYFGDSYNGVSNTGDYFLYYFSSLTSVDLNSLSNVTSINSSFLEGCSSLTSVDLSPLSNVTNIGASFLADCSSLTTLIMGAETPPTLGNKAFQKVNNLSLILVPSASVNAYKSANGWSYHSNKIVGY